MSLRLVVFALAFVLAALMLVGSGIAVGANSSSLTPLIVAFSFVERFQTLIAGALATGAAVASVIMISRQIELQRKHHSSNKKFTLRHEQRANNYAFQLGKSLLDYEWRFAVTNGVYKNDGKPMILSNPAKLLSDYEPYLHAPIKYQLEQLQLSIDHFNNGKEIEVYVAGEGSQKLSLQSQFGLMKAEAKRLMVAAKSELDHLEEMCV